VPIGAARFVHVLNFKLVSNVVLGHRFLWGASRILYGDSLKRGAGATKFHGHIANDYGLCGESTAETYKQTEDAMPDVSHSRIMIYKAPGIRYCESKYNGRARSEKTCSPTHLPRV
jgi:hypothetical protein